MKKHTKKIFMLSTKLYLHRCVLSLLAMLSCTLFADSPLTSISYWDISTSSLVQKTGRVKGKNKLTNDRFKFLIDSNTTIFDKIALVNAMGWDNESKFKNSDIFLFKIKNDYSRKTKKYNAFQYFSSPEDFIRIHSDYKGLIFEDNYIIYLYLLAMENYQNLSIISSVLDKLVNKDFLPDSYFEIDGKNYDRHINTKCALDFIKMLVSTQHLLLTKAKNCEVWEEYNNIKGKDYYSCISNLSIRKALLTSFNYFKYYSDSCERIQYDINTTYCFRNVIHASQSQKVWIINYPLFIYGDLSIYDDNNHEIYKAVIDGDDYIVLDISNYPIGKYRIQLISTKRELKETYNLELEIY